MDDGVLIGHDRLGWIRTVAQLAGLLHDLRRRDARRRAARERSYRDLAAVTGWSHARIGDYFAGRTVPPTDRFGVLIQMLGASAAEQRLLATARDRLDEWHRQVARTSFGAESGWVARNWSGGTGSWLC